jgi:hypothetical protein
MSNSILPPTDSLNQVYYLPIEQLGLFESLLGLPSSPAEYSHQESTYQSFMDAALKGSERQLSAHYPETYREFQPEVYDSLEAAVSPEEMGLLYSLPPTSMIEYLMDSGRLKLHGKEASELKQSLLRLVNGSPTFHRSFITGIAADQSYDLYIDSYKNLNAMMRSQNIDLEKDLVGRKEGEWSAFAMSDYYTLDNNEKPNGILDYPYDAFFNTDLVGNKGVGFKKDLDSLVAHEFGHLLLNLPDGDIGEAGPNQHYLANIMQEMDYAVSDKVVPTYATGGETLLITPELQNGMEKRGYTSDEQTALKLSLINDNDQNFFEEDKRRC